MTRDDVLRILDAYAKDEPPPHNTVEHFDDLDFQTFAMLLEDEVHDARLPQNFEDLDPPPPYASRDAFVDALMTYHASECHQQRDGNA